MLDEYLDRGFRWLVALGVLVNLSGLFVTVMEPDAALYATIARRMAESGDFVNLVAYGTDWLDKPHFPFWMAALSFRLWGVHQVEVAYKLPALLFWGMGVVYTYLFARRFYSKTVARLSVLFLLTAQHLILSNNDVRAEPYLVGLLAGSLYHWARASEPRFAHHLVLGALYSACAVMTKGPFLLIPVGAGLAVHWIATRQWRELLRARWWVGLALVGVFILPELYCLHAQFDLYPEKEVFGRTGISGLRFFFWDSQFGRFFNTGPIRGVGSPWFFLHTALWAFLPWSLWLVAAVVNGVLRKRSALPTTGREYFTWGASAVTFLLFSLSSFQLPHYLNIVFPFFAVMTADWVSRLASERSQRMAAGVQLGVAVLMALASAAILWLSQSPRMALGAVLLLAAIGIIGWSCRRSSALTRAVVASFGAAVVLNATLNLVFYPEVLRYQAGSEAAAIVNRRSARAVGLYGMNSNSFELYAAPRVERWDARGLVDAAQGEAVYVLLPADAVSELERLDLSVRAVETFDHFPVTRLTARFVLPSTRATAVRKVLLAEVNVARTIDARARQHAPKQ